MVTVAVVLTHSGAITPMHPTPSGWVWREGSAMSSLLRESPEPTQQPAQWRHAFDVDGEPGGPIRLEQLDRKTFTLRSTIKYRGPTGLEGAGLDPGVLQQIRTLDPAREEKEPGEGFLTDLASVPGPTRWFLGAYGDHTPAVLIHDWLIPTPENLDGMTDQYADRYLRFMLEHIGMRWLKRWVMWTAVALGTRIRVGGFRRLLVIAWVAAALLGMAMLVIAWRNGSTTWVAVALILPFVAAGLWGRQYGAGIIAAIAAPWLLPPTVLAVVGYGVYAVLERARELVVGSPKPGQPEPGTIMPEGV